MNAPEVSSPAKTPLLTRIVDVFLRPDLALALIVGSLAVGGIALALTPREEEPQIIVPMADVLIRAPGLSASEVEHQVTRRVEKLLTQIDGVEHVYSMSRAGDAAVTVRFHVGEDREDSLVKLYNKLHSNVDAVPPVVSGWVVKPIEVDDVPIVVVSLWTDRERDYSDYDLRRVAEELQFELQAIPDTNRVQVTGGRPRRVRVELDPQRLASRATSPLQVARALQSANVTVRAGEFAQQDRQYLVDAGTFLGDASDLQDLVVNLSAGRPVYLKDVATVRDGPAEAEDHSWLTFGRAEDPEGKRAEFYPAVHVSIAKRPGTNAVWVADAVEHLLRERAATHLPEGMHYRITRNYGETANDKVNELVEGLAIAVLTVVALIGVSLGWRAALVIALAIPVCYSMTLGFNLVAGYTINRVTMFALILSLGILVDDPITDVENIARYFAMRVLPPRQAVLRAVQEVRTALIMATLAVIVSFLPLVFITGMMGPYMRPMAINVPLTMFASMVVAFLITPWASLAALRGEAPTTGQNAGGQSAGGQSAGSKSERGQSEAGAELPSEFDVTGQPLYRFFRGVLAPLLDSRVKAWAFLLGVLALFVGSLILPLFRVVPLKMLPYDNKNEFQVVIDMPEGTTLDRTAAVTRRLATHLSSLSEVTDCTLFVGQASPMDFNGMVRHYFLRRGPHVADIRVNLLPKERREQQSHEIVLRVRNELQRIARESGAHIAIVETPPGPPVLSTITAEVYGPPDESYEALAAVAGRVTERLAREPQIVDVDSSVEAPQVRWVFETDKPKAALSGVSTDAVARTLSASLDGLPAAVLHRPSEVEPLWIELRLPRPERSAIEALEQLYVVGEQGQLVQLGSLGRFVERRRDQTIYHKDLRPVVFVYGEVAGRAPADAIVDMQVDRQPTENRSGGKRIGAAPPSVSSAGASSSNASDDARKAAATARPLAARTWFRPGGGDPWSLPAGYEVEWAGEGEWKITLDVFRDLGIAFAAALIGIYVILVLQTGSRVLPLIMMLAIPLTLIGILPGFWLLNEWASRDVGGYPTPVFFTATAMIGMISLAGIVVRNSVVLIDFVHLAQREGLSLREAIIRSAAIRTRPILLTAGTSLLGNWVIALDPIFSGLAWSIMFGIFASTVFTLVVIPVVLWESARLGTKE